MDRLDYILTVIDSMLDSKQKRHIIGGILMSVSMLFGRFGMYCNNLENGG